ECGAEHRFQTCIVYFLPHLSFSFHFPFFFFFLFKNASNIIFGTWEFKGIFLDFFIFISFFF
ncbi:hypothetical protein C1646_728180, partial [Rhizophagus diaphanus]